jgi:hypothetical protein
MPSAAPTPSSQAIRFNRDIRPILSDNCFFCHGPDKGQRKGKFRLDDRDSTLQKGAIVPGKPDQSPLVKRIFSNDSDEVMPPPSSHKKLSEQQKDLLKQWIAQGATFEPFWAYVIPIRPTVPTVANTNWVVNPIDNFVLQGLLSKNLNPVPEADRRTLLRRLSLDLIGLPPTPEEVSNFLADTSPNAYEKQVDRLLASPHYGERMAVPWLDAVRFADTVGFHGDQNINVFPYRDYVINAFNSNKPFDQFTIEQFAGDLLPHPTQEQLTATGFNRLNMVTREGGAQAKEYLAKYAADRVRTLGSAFLGSTLACCECHDHKFDPFSTKDFYSLESFWADVREWGIYMDYSYTHNPDLKGFSNDSPFPPEIVVDSSYLKQREQRLLSQLDQLAGETLHSEKRAASLVAWKKSAADFLTTHPAGWASAEHLPARDAKPPDDQIAVMTGKAGADERLTFSVPAGMIAAIRLEALPTEQHAGSILKAASARAPVEVTALLKHKSGSQDSLEFAFADADQKEAKYVNGHEVEGILRGWYISPAQAQSPRTAVYLLDHPVEASPGDLLTISLKKNILGAVRVSVSPLASYRPIDPSFASSLSQALAADRPLVERTMLLSTSDSADETARFEARRLLHDVMDCRDGKSPTVVVVSQAPRVMRVLHRGNWQDETGDIVTPSIPHFLPQPAAAGQRRLNRLDLAQWLVSNQNPLTARTIVNRLWKQFTGVGICNTVEDLGSQGDPPSDPELLDWLAVEFRESGWDVKHMVKLIVMSSTYRESSEPTDAMRDIDPFDRLAGSQLPRRLDAEFVRDNALEAAGLLNLAEIGGPSIFPYQPEGYYANIQFPNRTYDPDTDDRQYRRGVYMHWQRTFMHPMLANFDAPSREDTACTRNVSNTPLQALTLLNDPEFVEAARVLAEHTVAESGSDSGRIDTIYQRALCRLPSDAERDSLMGFLAEQRKYYGANAADAAALCTVGNSPAPAGINEPELAAWTTVCRVVLNLHESITRY